MVHLKNPVGRTVFALLALLLVLASTARAEEVIARYPHLPSGYSSITVFDRQGRFVGRLLPERRYWTTIDRIPVFLQKALVAVEDARFYEHRGIDLRGIARALVKDVAKGKLVEGGSTITQQLVKNKYLSPEKTIERNYYLDEAIHIASDYASLLSQRGGNQQIVGQTSPAQPRDASR